MAEKHASTRQSHPPTTLLPLLLYMLTATHEATLPAPRLSLTPCCPTTLATLT